MTAACLNSVGLILDIIGVVLLFQCGLPKEVRRGGGGSLLLEPVDWREAAKAKWYDRISYGALAFLILGFGLQIVSNHLD